MRSKYGHVTAFLAVAVFLVVSSLEAQGRRHPPRLSVTDLPTCNASRVTNLLGVDDASSRTSLGGGGGSVSVVVECVNDGGFSWVINQSAGTGGTGSGAPVENVIDDHGAAGDGATDDTDEIQAAIDAAEVGGGVVYFPPGVYLVGTAGIAIDSDDVTLMGHSAESSVIYRDDATTGDLFEITGADVSILRMGFDGNRANQSAGDDREIDVRGDGFQFIENSVINAEGYPLYIQDANRIRIEWNRFVSNERGILVGMAGASAVDISDIWIVHNFCDNSSVATADQTTGCYRVRGDQDVAAPNFVRDLHIIANTAIEGTDELGGSTTEQIWVQFSIDSEIVGNLIEGGSMGISVPGPQNMVIADNVITNVSDVGIEITAGTLFASDVTASGNIIEARISESGRCFAINGGTDAASYLENVSITGGTCSNSYYGVRITNDDQENVKISGVVFSDIEQDVLNPLSSGSITGLTFTNNRLYNFGRGGFYQGAGVLADVEITGNTFSADSSDSFIRLIEFTGATISGNTLIDTTGTSTQEGIDVSGASSEDVTILGNVIKGFGGAGGDGIIVSGAGITDCTFFGNHADDATNDFDLVGTANCSGPPELIATSTIAEGPMYWNADDPVSVEAYQDCETQTIESLADSDDDLVLWGGAAYTVDVVRVWAHCRGTCDATISFEDGDGNALTHGALTLATSGAATAVTPSAGNTLVPFEPLAIDVDSITTETDSYTVGWCWEATGAN